MMDDWRSTASAFLLNYGWLLTIITAAGVVMVAFVIGPLRRRRHSQAMLAQLGAATRSKLLNAQRSATTAPAVTLSGDFDAAFVPAPYPFVSLTVARSRAPLRGLFAPDARKRRGPTFDTLLFHGILPDLPPQELLWARGEAPDRALRRGDGAGLWTGHRMDLTGSEYITRGDNSGALQHTFFDLQRRYAPFLHQVFVQRGDLHHVTVRIRLAHGFNVEEIPALVNLIRAAGRAAQLE